MRHAIVQGLKSESEVIDELRGAIRALESGKRPPVLPKFLVGNSIEQGIQFRRALVVDASSAGE